MNSLSYEFIWIWPFPVVTVTNLINPNVAWRYMMEVPNNVNIRYCVSD